jgi:hypothetical protein
MYKTSIGALRDKRSRIPSIRLLHASARWRTEAKNWPARDLMKRVLRKARTERFPDFSHRCVAQIKHPRRRRKIEHGVSKDDN